MKYNIKITDNDTGAVIENSDCCCIIGAFGNAEGAMEVIAYDCNAFTVVGTMQSALKAVERICAQESKIGALAEFILKNGGMIKDE